MIEDFKIFKLDDLIDSELKSDFKTYIVDKIGSDENKWKIDKGAFIGSDEYQLKRFIEKLRKNNKLKLIEEFQKKNVIDYKLWKQISKIYGDKIQNNSLQLKINEEYHDILKKLMKSILYKLGWTLKAKKLDKLYTGHINVYPKGGNMHKHRDGSGGFDGQVTRLFTIIYLANIGRKEKDGGIFNIWDRYGKKYSVLPNIDNVVVINHMTSYDPLHEVTMNNIDSPRYSFYNVVNIQLFDYYYKNENMPVVNFVFEKLGKPNGKLGTTTNGIIYNLGITSLFYKNKYFDVNNIPDKKYIYLIEPFGGITNILYRNNFTNYISPQVLTDIREKKCTVLISTPSEGSLGVKDIKQLYRILEKNNLPLNQITFVQSNYNLDKQFDDFLESSSKYFDKINLIITEHKLETSKESFIEIKNGDWNSTKMKRLPTLNTIEEVENIKDKIRPYRFVSYNKSLRPDRVALLSLLYKEGIFDEGMISMGSERGGSAGSRQPWPTNFDFLTDITLRKEVEVWSKKLEPLRPMSIEGDVNVDDIDSGENEGANPCGYTYGEQYRKVYFQVVTEDVFEAKSMFFSQTTYKPIVSLTPFIMFGSPYMMKNLHEVQGFEIFSFIDESYDSEEDNNIRLNMIVAEIKRLCEMPIKDLHDCYYGELKVLKRNQERIFEAVASMDDYKLSRYLLSI